MNLGELMDAFQYIRDNNPGCDTWEIEIEVGPSDLPLNEVHHIEDDGVPGGGIVTLSP